MHDARALEHVLVVVDDFAFLVAKVMFFCTRISTATIATAHSIGHPQQAKWQATLFAVGRRVPVMKIKLDVDADSL